MSKPLKAAIIGKECVACGCCITTCPKAALYIDSGVTARVHTDLCVGCGRCAGICPAGVIEISKRRSAE